MSQPHTNITSHPFALVLHFYHEHLREKINEEDLDKIAKKYAKRQDKLVADLNKKYAMTWPMASVLSVAALQKYISTLPIPQSFKDVLAQDSVLNEALRRTPWRRSQDPYDIAFDPLECLRSTNVHCDAIPVASVDREDSLDNINKFTTLLKPHCERVTIELEEPIPTSFGRKRLAAFEDQEIALDSREVNTMSEAGAVDFVVQELRLSNSSFISDHRLVDVVRERQRQVTVGRAANEQDDRSTAKENRNPIDLIEALALPIVSYRNQKGVTVQLDSPLTMLRQLKHQKQRVRVVLRRRTSIRGHMDGYIRSFDKYFNLLMYDVDEEYISNKQRARSTAFGKFINQHNVMHRFLPQVLVRGDLVVSVFAVPRQPPLITIADLSQNILLEQSN